VNSSAAKVSEVVGGLKIPSPAALFTSSSGSLSAGVAKSTCPTLSEVPSALQIQFGYDISTGCILSLTRKGLKDVCCKGSASCSGSGTDYVNAAGLPYMFNTDPENAAYSLIGSVGTFGNADPLDVSQWQELKIKESSSAASSRRWNEDTGTCTGMFSSMNIQFLVAKTCEPFIIVVFVLVL
jgi:hypothetical protein